jgi:phospholipase C
MACAGDTNTLGAGPPGPPGPPGMDGGSGSGQKIKTVFLVLMENKSWSEVKGSADAPYVNQTLLPQASVAESYKGPNGGNVHPSEPNYIWLEAGDTLGIADDNDPAVNHKGTADHLVTLLDAAGVSWRSYQEDIAGDVCPLTSVGQYKPKHNPMVFFDDVTNANDPMAPRCIEHVRPLVNTPTEGSGGDFESDLAKGIVARYNFITPNQCGDMHSLCPPQNNEVKQGDDWLAEWIPKIQDSAAYKDGGALFITWDEAEIHSPDCSLANCPIGMFVVSPFAKGGAYSNTIAYDHSSTLKTIEEIFGVSPLLGGAADPSVVDLSDLFTSFP